MCWYVLSWFYIFNSAVLFWYIKLRRNYWLFTKDHKLKDHSFPLRQLKIACKNTEEAIFMLSIYVCVCLYTHVWWWHSKIWNLTKRSEYISSCHFVWRTCQGCHLGLAKRIPNNMYQILSAQQDCSLKSAHAPRACATEMLCMVVEVVLQQILYLNCMEV